MPESMCCTQIAVTTKTLPFLTSSERIIIPKLQLNPNFSNLRGKRKLVRKMGYFEKSGVTKTALFRTTTKKSTSPDKGVEGFQCSFQFCAMQPSCPKGTNSPPPPLLSTPGTMLFWLSSRSVHFFCYCKQHCNRGGGKRSSKLRL